jgi:hypothetical protein
MKIIKLFLEILGWLQITIGPTIVTGIIAFIIYENWPGETSKIISIILIISGFILGACWATRIWKKHGTIEWLSSIRRIS